MKRSNLIALTVLTLTLTLGLTSVYAAQSNRMKNKEFNQVDRQVIE